MRLTALLLCSASTFPSPGSNTLILLGKASLHLPQSMWLGDLTQLWLSHEQVSQAGQIEHHSPPRIEVDWVRLRVLWPKLGQ